MRYDAIDTLAHSGICAFSALCAASSRSKDEGNELRGERMQEELWPYYRGLLEKYGLGGRLRW